MMFLRESTELLTTFFVLLYTADATFFMKLLYSYTAYP